jgi:peroxiredoxin
MSAILNAGAKAPDFSLSVTPDQKITLSELRGKPVILAFYPADWSPVCGDQMALYNEVLPEFQNFGAELIGISVDGAWCHAAYAKDHHLHFPLAADFEPKGAGSTVRRRDSANAHSSSSTKTGSLPGATARRSRSIRAQMEYCRH